jgi:hypothetical protein
MLKEQESAKAESPIRVLHSRHSKEDKEIFTDTLGKDTVLYQDPAIARFNRISKPFAFGGRSAPSSL